MPKTFILTDHARKRMLERGVSHRWAMETVFSPDWAEPEPRHINAERRFRAIRDFGERVLRVVCVETDDAIRVITVTWDRRAKRKP